jgi:AAA domain
MGIVRQLAKDIKPTEVKWLWPKYIPLGQLTILDGDPGAGKSFLTMDIAARLSSGRGLPGSSMRTPPRKVLICNEEDDSSSTLVPRLMKLGANLENIELNPKVQLPRNKSRPLILPDDCHFLEQLLADFRPCLCIIDPIMGFLSAEVRTFQDQAIRQALNPLKDLAQAFQVAILLVRHLNKSQAAKAIYRGGGSIGLVGLCRSALLAGENPDVRGERILTQIKNNLAKRQPAQAYDLYPDKGTQAFAWLGQREVTADQALLHNVGQTPLAETIQKLKEYLAAGPVPARDAVQHIIKCGLRGNSTARAQKAIPVISTKIRKIWYWSLSPISDSKKAELIVQSASHE